MSIPQSLFGVTVNSLEKRHYRNNSRLVFSEGAEISDNTFANQLSYGDVVHFQTQGTYPPGTESLEEKSFVFEKVNGVDTFIELIVSIKSVGFVETDAHFFLPGKGFQQEDIITPFNINSANLANQLNRSFLQNGDDISKLNNDSGYITISSIPVKSVNGNTGIVNLTTANISEATNLYFTQTRVDQNANVIANTSARHSPVTIATGNGLSLSNQALSLALASTTTAGAMSASDKTLLASLSNVKPASIVGMYGGSADLLLNLNVNVTQTIPLGGTSVTVGTGLSVGTSQIIANTTMIAKVGFACSFSSTSANVGLTFRIRRQNGGTLSTLFSAYSRTNGAASPYTETVTMTTLVALNTNNRIFIECGGGGGTSTNAATFIDTPILWVERVD